MIAFTVLALSFAASLSLRLLNLAAAWVSFLFTDSVGKTTWDKSLKCLRPLGMLVLFGNSSGPVPPIVRCSLLCVAASLCLSS